MAAITISRQMGSLGCDVARTVADTLGYRLVRRELIDQAARQSSAPEVALAFIDELGLLDICPSPEACSAYRQIVANIMQEQAAEGNVVIIGRAGQVILANYPKTLHVRIIAPAKLRAERVAKRQNISLVCAHAQIETSDSYRVNYLQRFYQVHSGNPELYHMTLNTGRLSVQQAAGLIHQALYQMIQEETTT